MQSITIIKGNKKYKRRVKNLDNYVFDPLKDAYRKITPYSKMKIKTPYGDITASTIDAKYFFERAETGGIHLFPIMNKQNKHKTYHPLEVKQAKRYIPKHSTIWTVVSYIDSKTGEQKYYDLQIRFYTKRKMKFRTAVRLGMKSLKEKLAAGLTDEYELDMLTSGKIIKVKYRQFIKRKVEIKIPEDDFKEMEEKYNALFKEKDNAKKWW
ncbi:MAG: hypothetical protein ABIK73_07260 [candidate division WOR-3 bacterium]